VYVLVSGLPGSGKSTVARPLAATLGWPLLSKDVIKEVLWDVLGSGDRQHSARLGAAAQEVLFRAAADAPCAVIDTFVHHGWKHQLLALPAPVVEVHCACPVDVARARYAARRRHASHFDADLLADTWDRWEREDSGPIAVGPVPQVDTSQPVGIDSIARWIGARRKGAGTVGQ
jgi:predicted kinase